MTRRTLMDEVLDDMAEKARTGTPDTHWTCGQCGLDGTQGVCAYYHRKVVGTRKGKEIIDFDMTLVCPCCSFDGCPHKWASCEICGKSTAPTGSHFSGGPFVRCDGPESHIEALIQT